MASETKFAGTGASISGGGTVPWSNPERITAEDGSSATVALWYAPKFSDYIKGTNFGFGIPTNATILGVELGFKVWDSGGGLATQTNVARLVKGGVISGSDLSDSAAWSLVALTWKTLGGSTNMWGLALTPADCNASDFGAVVSGLTLSAGIFNVATMDAMKITVYYLVPPAVQGFVIAP